MLTFFLGKNKIKRTIAGNKEMQLVLWHELIAWLHHPLTVTLSHQTVVYPSIKWGNQVRTTVTGFSITKNPFYISSTNFMFWEILSRLWHLYCSNSFVSLFIVFSFQSYSNFEQQCIYAMIYKDIMKSYSQNHGWDVHKVSIVVRIIVL